MTASATQNQIAPADLSIKTIRSFRDFLDLESVWNQVLERAELCNPFLEHAWVRTWLECFGTESELHIVLVSAGDTPIAIAPLILTVVRMWGIKVRRLGFAYNAHVPRTDFIVARGRGDAYAAIWNHLRWNCNWDLLQLCQLPETSATLELSVLAAQDNCRIGLWESGASPYIVLHGGWTKYYEALAPKHRSNVRNRFKRLNERGTVEIETIASGTNVAQALQEGLAIEAAAWKREAGTAIISDQDISRFYVDFAQRAAERGWLRLNFLRAGPDRIAFDYSLLYRNRVFLLKLGYDPAFSPFSPSNLLLSLTLRNAFDQACEGYDFLGEQADWKQCWTKQSTSHFWLFIFADSFKGRVLNLIKFRVIPVLRTERFRRLRSFASRLAARVNRRRP